MCRHYTRSRGIIYLVNFFNAPKGNHVCSIRCCIVGLWNGPLGWSLLQCWIFYSHSVSPRIPLRISAGVPPGFCPGISPRIFFSGIVLRSYLGIHLRDPHRMPPGISSEFRTELLAFHWNSLNVVSRNSVGGSSRNSQEYIPVFVQESPRIPQTFLPGLHRNSSRVHWSQDIYCNSFKNASWITARISSGMPAEYFWRQICGHTDQKFKTSSSKIYIIACREYEQTMLGEMTASAASPSVLVRS